MARLLVAALVVAVASAAAPGGTWQLCGRNIVVGSGRRSFFVANGTTAACCLNRAPGFCQRRIRSCLPGLVPVPEPVSSLSNRRTDALLPH